jgi:hypothetical protein
MLVVRESEAPPRVDEGESSVLAFKRERRHDESIYLLFFSEKRTGKSIYPFGQSIYQAPDLNQKRVKQQVNRFTYGVNRFT